MKIITSYKNLKKALSVTEKIVSKNPSLPILNNLLLKSENGRLKITATNLEIGINYLIGAKIDEPGELAVPAKIFSDFMSNVSDEKISLNTKGNILQISTDKYKTQILGFDPKDFPLIPKIKDAPVCSLPAGLLKNGLMSVFDSTALSESRPELSGVYVNLNKEKIVLASTDSFRLTERIISYKTDKNLDFILPRTTVAEMIRITGDIEGDVNLQVKDNQICLSNDDFEFVSRLIDGVYPDYKKIIPDKFISKVLINKLDLEKNTKLAGLFSSNISDIKISCQKEKMLISSKNSDKGEIQVFAESILKNEPFEISFNYQYLLDGLKIIPTDKAILEYTGKGSPIVLRPADDKKELLYLVMPFRN